MNSPSFDIVSLLSDNSLGTIGVDLFGAEWGAVDAQTLVIDTGGFDSPLQRQYEQPSFQILVRGGKGASAIIAHDKARAIHEFLITRDTMEINSVWYLEFEYNSLPTGLGRDENDRYIYSANYWTYRNPL